MTRYLFFIAPLLLIACVSKTKTSQTLDFGAFTIKTPAGWTKFTEQGEDSYVGGLTNGQDSLFFDYGMFSAEKMEDNPPDYVYTRDTINGLPAVITISKPGGRGIVMLGIPHVDNRNRFSLAGVHVKNTELVLQIFKSVVFTESAKSPTR